jgi:uncharacterized membrane protein YphA (DoxX/SURF4 family)
MENMKKMIPMMMVMMVIVISAALFVVQGVTKQNKVAETEATFHALQTDLLTNYTKSDRDNADTGSELAQKQAEAANYPSTLLELKLVGVGKILTGIALLLVGILMSLIIMPVRLGRIIKNN